MNADTHDQTRPAGGPTAAILITGSELVRGETRDANGPYLGAQLAEIGVSVREIRILPDELRAIESGVREAVSEHEIVIVSGGLGPTADDLTLAAAARALGRKVIRDAEAAARMRERALARVGSEDRIPENFYKQAEVIEGATVLQNPVGLAPGCLVETARGILAVLPGVPRELRALFRERLAPELQRRFRLDPPQVLRALVLGHGESWVEARIAALGIDRDLLEYGISARPGEILLKFFARSDAARQELARARERLEKEFGEDLVWLPEALFQEEERSLERAYSRLVHEALLASGRTLATAESCTGGLIAKRLTDHAGSSGYFLGGVVAYDNRIKEEVLGVPADLLRRYGAVSEEVCRAMVEGARRLFASDYQIAVTGIAGPGGGTPEKPVGLVYLGLGSPGAAEVFVERKLFTGDREHIRNQAAVRALDLVRRDLVRNTPQPSARA